MTPAQLICIVAIYIDDITLASDSLEEITKAKEALNLTFDMTDLGENQLDPWDASHSRRAHPMATPSLPNEQLEKLKESEPDVDVTPVPERSGHADVRDARAHAWTFIHGRHP